MKNIWYRISNIGVTSGLAPDEARIINLLNRICFIVCLFLIGYIPLLYLFGEETVIPLLLIEIILFSSTFYFVKKKKFTTAKLYFYFNILLFLGIIGLIPGKESADKYLLIASSALPLLFFKKKSLFIPLFLINVLLFLSIYTYQRQHAALLHLPHPTIIMFYYINMASTFFLIFLMIFYFKNINEAYQVKLLKKNKIIEQKNRDITDSIRYAKRIQNAILISGEYLEQTLNQHFVLFKPKDVVSGDFYWARQIKDKVIWTVADCTGHGVPGAFMSMIGISLLNEIIIEKEITETDKILTEMKKSIIKTLAQPGKGSELRDGMDMALCVWHKKNNELEFSGANNPLYLIRKRISRFPLANAKNTKLYGEDLLEFKPDKRPIGFDEKTYDSFSKHIIPLQKDDTLYVFSDGYQDQYGGEKNKKFMKKRFRKLLLSIQEKSMPEQKEILDITIENWKKDQEQIDDICVIGVRI